MRIWFVIYGVLSAFLVNLAVQALTDRRKHGNWFWQDKTWWNDRPRD